jgi:hypothetical protein
VRWVEGIISNFTKHVGKEQFENGARKEER